jgi:hypothetical protein
MNDILFRFFNDAAYIFSEDSLNGHRDGIHQVFSKIDLDEVFLEPVVADELALAVADFDAREAVCFAALELLDIVAIIVSDVFTKSRLFVELWLFPLRAIGVTHVVGAFVPRLENRHSVFGVLYDHEAGVGIGAVETIRVELWLFGGPWVLGHGDGMIRRDIPVVHHPLDGNVQEAKCGIGVEEDDEFVVFDVVRKRRGLDPGCMSIFKICGVHKLVVVAVDKGIGVVVEDAAGNVIDVAPVVFALFKVFGRLQRARLEVQDQDLTAQVLLVARVRRQLDVAAVGFADEGLGRRRLEGRVEYSNNLGYGYRRLFVGDGSVRLLSARVRRHASRARNCCQGSCRLSSVATREPRTLQPRASHHVQRASGAGFAKP